MPDAVTKSVVRSVVMEAFMLFYGGIPLTITDITDIKHSFQGRVSPKPNCGCLHHVGLQNSSSVSVRIPTHSRSFPSLNLSAGPGSQCCTGRSFGRLPGWG